MTYYSKAPWRTFLALALLTIGMVVVLPLVSPTVGPSQAQAMTINKPLMIVRFNQRKVYFEQQLYSAISKAVAAKPTVTFRLVSYIPRSGNVANDQKNMNEALQNARSIADSMVSMGVPMQRISVMSELDPSLRYDETHIFVQ